MIARDEDDVTPGRRWWHRPLTFTVMLAVLVGFLVVCVIVARLIDTFLTAQLGKFESRATAWTVIMTYVLCKFPPSRKED